MFAGLCFVPIGSCRYSTAAEGPNAADGFGTCRYPGSASRLRRQPVASCGDAGSEPGHAISKAQEAPDPIGLHLIRRFAASLGIRIASDRACSSRIGFSIFPPSEDSCAPNARRHGRRRCEIEPPGGCDARNIAPFSNDDPHPDHSLYWWAYNRNKRSITLNLDRQEGQVILRQLVHRADFLIESYNPGHLAKRRLGFTDLSAINPALIYVSITGFGQHGPKASYADSDLVIMAAGGPLILMVMRTVRRCASAFRKRTCMPRRTRRSHRWLRITSAVAPGWDSISM